MKRRILSLFLAVVMIVLAIPAAILPTLAATVSNEDGVYKTGFSFLDDIYNYAKDKTGGSKIVLKDNWEVGMMMPDEWNNSYTVAQSINTQFSYVYTGKGTWMNGALAGGYYYAGQNSLIFTSEYDATNSGGVADKREWVRVTSNVLVRYTAEYAGTVEIDVSQLKFKNNWSSLFAIMVDGQPAGDFATGKFGTFNYATGAGWYDPTTTDDVAGDFSTITVKVEKGSTVDFIFRGTNDCDASRAAEEGFTFAYSESRYTSGSFNFDVTYTSIEGLENDATVQHIFDANDYNPYYLGQNKTGAGRDVIFVQDAAWQMGYIPVSYDIVAALNAGVGKDYSLDSIDKLLTIGSGFTPYNNNHTDNGAYQNFYTSTSNGHNGLLNGASGGFLQESSAATATLKFCPGTYYQGAPKIQFNEATGKFEQSKTENYDGSNGELGYNRYLVAYPAAATLRYTAEYGGNVKIDLTGTFGYANVANLSWLFVYVNGVRVKAIQNTGDASSQTFSILELTELKPGDTVDIMNVVDPRYGILMATETINKVDADGNVTGTVACPWYNEEFKDAGKWKAGNNGMDNGGRRGFSVTSITTTITNPYYGGESVWNGENAIQLNKNNALIQNYTNSQPIPLFRWYKMVEGVETHIDFGGALTEGCYAEINPVMAEAAGIDLEEDSYATVLDKYIAYLTTTYTVNPKNSDWQYGATEKDGRFSPFVCYGFYHNVDIGLTTSQKVGYPYTGQFLTSAIGIDSQVRNGWKAYANKGVILDASTGNAITEATTGANVKVNYSDALSGYKGPTSNGCAGATAQAGVANQGPAFIRPNGTFASMGSGSFVYTAQESGMLTVNFDKLTFKERDPMNVAFSVTINGVTVIGPTNFTVNGQGDVSADFLKTFNAQFESFAPQVKAGDKISFNFARVDSGFAVAPVISVAVRNVMPTFENTVNLSITDAYHVKVTAVPSAEDGKIDVLVDGEVVATLDKASKFTGVVKGDLKVNELTASPKADGGQDGTTVSYQLREERGHYIVTSGTYSITTNEMLAYYEASNDATTKALATNLRYLAQVAHWIKTGQKGDLEADVKNWIKCGGANNFSLSGLKEVDGNTVASAQTGATFTNWDSGLTDRMLATMQGLTAEDYYKNYWYKTEGDDTQKYAHFDPVAGVSKLVEGVDYGYAAGTDFEAFPYVIAGANVNLGDKLSLVLLIDATADASIWDLKNNGYKVIATCEGVTVDPATEFAGVVANNKEYIGVIVDVPISVYDKTLDIVLKDAEGNDASVTMKYSVKAWCVNKYVFGQGSFNDYLVRAVYNVGVAAAAYAEAHAGN